ncbi:MAG: Hsp20/alpha crystallin family protein [Bacteroidetes bacterium]|nr:Hsp20/alpha crystallin family protein [Bacteroidota bacterium]
MKLAKYRPFETGNLFDDFFNNFWDRSFSDLASTFQFNQPAMNVAEESDHYRIELAAPGLEKADFDLKVDNGMLTVKVEKESKEEESAEGNFSRREFNYTRFSRSFQLPDTVKTDEIDAVYENGLLVVSLPKVESAKVQPVRKIEIK